MASIDRAGGRKPPVRGWLDCPETYRDYAVSGKVSEGDAACVRPGHGSRSVVFERARARRVPKPAKGRSQSKGGFLAHHKWRCSDGLNPPASRRHLAM